MKRIVPLVPLLVLGLLVLGLPGCTRPPAVTEPEATVTEEPTATAKVDAIELPDGFQPEGITAAGDMVYVGSIPTGAIYRASIQSGEGTVAVASQSSRAALGIKIDQRGQLFVAGGGTGKAFVYDAANGEGLASYALSEAANTFVNDVALSDGVAWFTDSRQAVLYRLEIPAGGQITGDEKPSALKLTGDFKLQKEALNLNGIVVAGDRLIVVQSGAGMLFSVDPESGVTAKIDLGGETVKNGDGLLLDGQTLYVVQNKPSQVAVIDLADDLSSGTVRTRITDPALDVPSTIAQLGDSLYVVNARFGTTAEADTPYSVTRVDKP